MRFRRRIRIAPGVGLNLSGSGIGFSAGVPGISLSIGKKGLWANTSIPGTGLYQRKKLSGGGSAAPRNNKTGGRNPGEGVLDRLGVYGLRAMVSLDGGPIRLADESGSPIDPALEDDAWKCFREHLLEEVEAGCAKSCARIDSLATLHRSTPPATPPLEYSKARFGLCKPQKPAQKKQHWFWKILPCHRKSVDLANAKINDDFQVESQQWQAARTSHENIETDRRNRFLSRNEMKQEGVEQFLEWHLAGLEWPLDTSVDLTLSENATRLCLDVDFPELESLPTGLPHLAVRSRSVRIKPFSETAKRKLYAAHVHAVMFRLMGEAFHAAPTVQEVVASGYTQRIDPATGAIRDDYLISVTVGRAEWAAVDFSRLGNIDVLEALTLFPLRRKMTATGVFRIIEPFK